MFHVVDDQPYLREVMGDLLKMAGARVKSFASPLEYIDYVESDGFENPVATFTDVDMPAMNGYQMMEHLLRIRPDMKFVVVSGEASIKHPCMDKACMYLLKPFHPDIVAEIVNKLRRCDIEGPNSDIGCAQCGDHESFVAKNWICPKK